MLRLAEIFAKLSSLGLKLFMSKACHGLVCLEVLFVLFI